LHAWRLRFPQPTTGAPVEVTAPIPADLVDLVAEGGYSADAPPPVGSPPA
ncbi:MAG: RluA family pseudouridine synthase, partial [Deltaproteobacteria bacterium]